MKTQAGTWIQRSSVLLDRGVASTKVRNVLGNSLLRGARLMRIADPDNPGSTPPYFAERFLPGFPLAVAIQLRKARFRGHQADF